MAISDTQKIDYLFKKLGYGVTKTDTNANKTAINEAIPSPLLIRGDKLWAQAGLIPTIKPGSTSGVVTVYSNLEATEDNTASNNRTWKTAVTDWIPPEFGSTYQVTVYAASSGESDPVSNGTRLFASGSGNNDEWFFDYQSGILHFIGSNLPSSMSGSNVVFISGATYTGVFGSGTSGSGGTLLDSNTAIELFDSAYVIQRSSNYIQTQIDNLVDAAPGALDTLNELAAAINDDSVFSVTITNSIATKVAIADFETYFDSNLGRETSINSIRGYFSADGDLSYDSATGRFEIDVEQIYTKTNFDSDLNLALLTDAITTTNLTEGNKLYYTRNRFDSDLEERLGAIDFDIIPDADSTRSLGSVDKRFKDLWLSGETLILGTLSISDGGAGTLNISEVDSYGNVTSAIGALSAKNLDNAINLDLDSIGQQMVDTYSAAQYRTARYVIQIEHDSSSKYHSTEILLMHNNTEVYMTEYAVLRTDSALGEITADISDGNVRLLMTPSFTNTSIKAKRLIIDA